MTALPRRYDLPRAGKALKDLLANPDDLPKVFTVIESMPGRALERMRDRILSTDEGKAMLSDRPNIVAILSDREKLRAMPRGSLAHAYLAFVESENISAQGIVDAASVGEKEKYQDEFTWQHDRMRDTHDLWHAVTGYKGDVLGELALLCFSLGQNFHPGVAFLISGAVMRGLEATDAWLLAEGYVHGKRAAFLPGVRWENLLALPLEEVRTRLNIAAPPKYTPVRTSDMRAQGTIA